MKQNKFILIWHSNIKRFKSFGVKNHLQSAKVNFCALKKLVQLGDFWNDILKQASQPYEFFCANLNLRSPAGDGRHQFFSTKPLIQPNSENEVRNEK